MTTFPKSPFKDDKMRAPAVFGGSKNESLNFACTGRIAGCLIFSSVLIKVCVDNAFPVSSWFSATSKITARRGRKRLLKFTVFLLKIL